jgi:hypothetical protein
VRVPPASRPDELNGGSSGVAVGAMEKVPVGAAVGLRADEGDARGDAVAPGEPVPGSALGEPAASPVMEGVPAFSDSVAASEREGAPLREPAPERVGSGEGESEGRAGADSDGEAVAVPFAEADRDARGENEAEAQREGRVEWVPEAEGAALSEDSGERVSRAVPREDSDIVRFAEALRDGSGEAVGEGLWEPLRLPPTEKDCEVLAVGVEERLDDPEAAGERVSAEDARGAADAVPA